MVPSSRFADDDERLHVLWEEGERVFCWRWPEKAPGEQPAVLIDLPAREHPSPAILDRLAH